MELEGEHFKFSFGAMIAVIGVILIGLGVAWLIALNWYGMPAALKVVILVIATSLSFGAGVFLRIKNHPNIGGSLLLLGAILYTLSIFLIAQIFSTSASIQGTAFLLLLAWIGVLFSAYIFDSPVSLILALGEFLVWISLQYFAFMESAGFNNFAIGILAIIYLSIAIFLYGLTQIHKSKEHKFFNVYRYWTAFYILLLTYILSFQIVLPYFWPKGFSINPGTLIFLITFVLISIIAAFTGISMSFHKEKLSSKEIMSFIGIILVYILLISLASLVAGENAFYGRAGISTGLFFMWIIDNIFFIFVILSVIGYGVKYKSPKIVNLAITFFVLDIITRYIGFILDFGGQIGFAVISIIGGVILIFGGWGVEKWREKLVKKAKTNNQ